MRHPIDPKIDCVFKALLGSQANRALLIHFLNATLGQDLAGPLTEVEILNPYNEREFLADKLSIVDVKSRDQAGRLYQIELQLLNLPELPARMLYGWADLYSAQLQDGEPYERLRPTYAIWLLGQTLRPGLCEWFHRFRLRDDQGRELLDHGGLYLLELSKFAAETVVTELERWLKFFIEAPRLDESHLPEWMHTQEMHQAMSTLKAFSEKERAYHAYQSRQNYLRQQISIQRHLDALQVEARQERAAKEQERAAKEQERAAKEQAQQLAEQERTAKEQERLAKESALAEIERLKAQLRDQGY
ncbi:PD-(D/E)XK nuclease family transposase [Thiorhodovibrio winogradskyi]|uniref:PD-(D/E)XK nuclease family transposase n=1 Tax=Thiorhodovibrio winogradskyi TaxID=77007 RepID=A0ABZ0SFW4_9GAMM|nr:Rpn family recombination-promoting nuclease/putative transposase [Thiorhodovibrio winogradskyi]